jgi:hypothetical protein
MAIGTLRNASSSVNIPSTSHWTGAAIIGYDPDEDIHRHAVENIEQADALPWPSDLRNDGGSVAVAGAPE